MNSLSPQQGVELWFTNLSQFQVACNNTSISQLDLLTFANSPILTALPTAAEQNTFITSAGAATGYDDMALSDLTTYKTFEALLDYWNPLPTVVAILLQSLAVPALQGVSSADFLSAAVADAFPGGSTGTAWGTALGSLKSCMRAVCFTPTFQAEVGLTVDKTGSKMSDLISQIAVLG